MGCFCGAVDFFLLTQTHSLKKMGIGGSGANASILFFIKYHLQSAFK